MRFYEDLFCRSRGRLPQRCYYIPDGDATCTMLNGTWRFCFFEDGDRAGEPKAWDEIAVPGCWQLQGFEKPNYSNINYPYPYDPPFVPTLNPMGVYERDFELTLDGRRHYLVLEGVSSMATVYLNGTEVGFTQGSHLQAEFDLTDYVKNGKNRLRIAVRKWCCGSYLEDQDFFRMNGIFRDVYLLSRPEGHIVDYSVKVDCRSADISVDREATVSLLDGERVICSAIGTSMRFEPENVRLWNAEQPNLYTLRLECAGEVITQTLGFRTVNVSSRREILINGQSVKLKGINRHDSCPQTGWYMTDEQILRDLRLIKSLNINTVRTAHYPPHPKMLEMCDRLGLYVILETDIETHGVLRSEADVDYHYNPDSDIWPCTNRDWHDSFVERMERAYERDKNYSCIIMWSTGNESAHGPNHVAMIEWLLEHDNSRLIHSEDANRAYADRLFNLRAAEEKVALARLQAERPKHKNMNFSALWANPLDGNELVRFGGAGVAEAEAELQFAAEWYERARNDSNRCSVYSRMYSTIDELKDWAADAQSIPQPIFLCEYSHSMGLGPGDVHDYVEAFYSHPALVGGCIWEWADHTVVECGVQKYGGDWSETTHDGNFCCDGMVFADRSFKSGTMAVKTAYAPFRFSYDKGMLTVENRCDFNNLDRYDFICTVTVDGGVTADHHIQLSAAPHTNVTLPLDIDLPQFCRLGAYINLTMLQDGEQIGTLQQQLDCPVSLECSDSPEAILGEDERYVYAQGDSFSYRLNKATGSFDSMVINGREHLSAPIKLGAFRAITDNDRPMQAKWAFVNIWEGENLDRTFTKIYSVKVSGGAISIDGSLAGVSRRPFLRYTLRLRVLADGTVEVLLDGKVADSCTWLPRLGFELQMPTELDHFEYFGRGPMDNYCDMCHHAPVGLYRSTAAEQYVPYVRPQEHGNHCDTRYMRIGDIEFAADDTMEINVSRYSIAQLHAATHTDELGESFATHVRLDYKASGVGSNSCGPALDRRYRLDEKDIHFSLTFRPAQ